MLYLVPPSLLFLQPRGARGALAVPRRRCSPGPRRAPGPAGAHPRLLSPRLLLHGAVGRPPLRQHAPPEPGWPRRQFQYRRLASSDWTAATSAGEDGWASEQTSTPSDDIRWLQALLVHYGGWSCWADETTAAGRPGPPSRIPAAACMRGVLVSGRHYLAAAARPQPLHLRRPPPWSSSFASPASFLRHVCGPAGCAVSPDRS